MKNLLANLSLILFISLALSTTSFAQKDFDPEKKAKKKTEWMKKELSLSEDQVAKVDAINLKYVKKKKEIREQMRQQMKALHEEEKKELSQVLTKEQQEKLKAKREEMKAKRKEQKGKEEEENDLLDEE